MGRGARRCRSTSLELSAPNSNLMKTHFPVLCSLVLLGTSSFGQNQAPSKPDSAVAVVAGEPISEHELLEALGPQLAQLRNQEYELKTKALEELIRRKLVEAEAKKRGISSAKLLEQEADSKIAEPTEAEIEAFFLGQNRAGASLDEARDELRVTLKQIRIQKARQAYADSLRAKNEVTILLRAPRINLAYDARRVRGNPQAPVIIVEFYDFQCPFCKASESTIKALLSKYEGRIKLAVLDFPLSEIHPLARRAAEAARCAGEQDKFWEYHDSLFEAQSKLGEVDLFTRARALKLDESAFLACLNSGKFRPYIEADRKEGANAGVVGTPGFFINGVFLDGAQPQATFERLIDQALTGRP